MAISCSLFNKEGIRVVSQVQTATPAANDNISLSDLETVTVLGKGSRGVVQLVRHKWTVETYALKVIHMNIEETMRKQIVKELKINYHASQCPYVVIFPASTFVCLRHVSTAGIYDAIKNGLSHFCGAPVVLNVLVNSPESDIRSHTHAIP